MSQRKLTLQTNFKFKSEIAFFCITLLCDWSRKLVPLSQPIKRKNVKPITTSTLAFSCALSVQSILLEFLLALKGISFPLIGRCDYFGFGFTLSSYWLLKVFSFLLIGRCDYFGFGFCLGRGLNNQTIVINFIFNIHRLKAKVS